MIDKKQIDTYYKHEGSPDFMSYREWIICDAITSLKIEDAISDIWKLKNQGVDPEEDPSLLQELRSLCQDERTLKKLFRTANLRTFRREFEDRQDAYVKKRWLEARHSSSTATPSAITLDQVRMFEKAEGNLSNLTVAEQERLTGVTFRAILEFVREMWAVRNGYRNNDFASDLEGRIMMSCGEQWLSWELKDLANLRWVRDKYQEYPSWWQIWRR